MRIWSCVWIFANGRSDEDGKAVPTNNNQQITLKVVELVIKSKVNIMLMRFSLNYFKIETNRL
jgi:hypothetical protein